MLLLLMVLVLLTIDDDDGGDDGVEVGYIRGSIFIFRCSHSS